MAKQRGVEYLHQLSRAEREALRNHLAPGYGALAYICLALKEDLDVHEKITIQIGSDMHRLICDAVAKANPGRAT